MKTLFIPAKSKIKLNKSNLKGLPKDLALVYSIQYKEIAEQIKKILKPIAFTQVLGCSKPKFPKQTKAILLIGDGKFHAKSLAFETKLPTYIYNNRTIEKITKKDTEQMEQNQKASYMKYLHADNIGLLISTKPGQQNLKRAIQFKNKSKKKTYLFIENNLNTTEFENFPQIESWINTACPRMDMVKNSSIININQI
jgi:2-(3-amino-3-carboxypropyl)histidine synthase